MKFYSFFLLVLISGVIFAQKGDPVIESKSGKSFTETIEFIKSAAESKGWKVLIVHDLQASLKKAGQEILPVSVIEVCKPAFSGPVLQKDNYRALSVMMPCRVSVYEKAGGEIFISRMDVSGLKNSSFGEDAAGMLTKASDEIEEMLKKIIVE